MKPGWLTFVDGKRRYSLLRILSELSRLQDKENLNFILIGALPLLLSDYLHYTALWDIDLLFRNESEMNKFTQASKTQQLRIVDYDDALTSNENIASFHSAWTFDKQWFNVDYILKTDLFEFLNDDLTSSPPFHDQAHWQDTDHMISLYQAHPWDIIVSKVVSPRTARDISLRVNMSIDIRHIFAVYRAERDNELFWHHIISRARFFCHQSVFADKFLELLRAAPELGYEGVTISPTAAEALQLK